MKMLCSAGSAGSSAGSASMSRGRSGIVFCGVIVVWITFWKRNKMCTLVQVVQCTVWYVCNTKLGLSLYRESWSASCVVIAATIYGWCSMWSCPVVNKYARVYIYCFHSATKISHSCSYRGSHITELRDILATTNYYQDECRRQDVD